jgi:hypothetical protein
MIVAPPGSGVEIEAVLDVPVTPTLDAFDELQVSGTPLMLFPAASIVVAVAEMDVPGGTVRSVLLLPFATREMDSTGQIVTGVAMLFAEPALAEIVVSPMAFAVACASFFARPAVVVERPSTALFPALQVKGPSVEVMSVPWLNPLAWKMKVCPLEMQLATSGFCDGAALTTTLSTCWCT